MANTRTFLRRFRCHRGPPRHPLRPPSARSLSPNRHRLRAVDRDEVARLSDVADFLPPGATWLPAPQHTLPTLPGQPPMIGYLVLVPADQQPALAGAVAASQHGQQIDRQGRAAFPQQVATSRPRRRRPGRSGSTRPGVRPPSTGSPST